jgi:hypothetical protein
MPKHVKARGPQDEREERAVRKLARSHRAPSAWTWHARMVVASWAGKSPDQMATELHCHPQTVRIHVARFNQRGIEGLGVQPGSGHKPRLSEAERACHRRLAKPPTSWAQGCATRRDDGGAR